MSKVFEALGGRKAVGLLVVLAIAVPVAISLGDVPPNLMTILLGAFGTFSVANAGVHVAQSRVAAVKKSDAGRPKKVDLSELKSPIEDLSKQVASLESYLSTVVTQSEEQTAPLAETLKAISNRQTALTQQVTGLGQGMQQLVNIFSNQGGSGGSGQ